MSDKKIPISVVISAVDNITYKVLAIQEKLDRVTKPIGKVTAAISTLGAESGFTGLMKGIGEIGSTGKELLDKTAEAFLKITGTAIAAGTALFEVAHGFSEQGDHVNTLSKRLGLTSDAYQELAYAANKAQVPQEEFDASMTKFTKGIGEAAAGTGEAFIAFNALQISVRDSHGQIKSMEQLLPQVADRLGALHSQELKNTLAMKIFGREGAKLNEIFGEGSEGLKKLRQEARDVGAIMTPEQIKNAREFDDGLKSVMATLLMVRNVVGNAISPVFVKLGENLQKYILSHKDEIAKWADQFAQNLPGYIDQLIKLFGNLAAILGPVVAVFNALSSVFGSMNVAIAGLLTYFGGPLIGPLFKFVKAIGSVLPEALSFATSAFSLLWEVVSGLFIFIASIIGWPATLAIAIVAAFTLMYKKIQPFADFIDGLISKIKGLFSGGGDLNGTVNMIPQPGPGLNFDKPVDASSRNSSSLNENHLIIDFNNTPKGTRVETKKSDSMIDLNMGYGAGIG